MTSCASIGIAATALRYQNVYGPGQSLSNPYTGILSIFSTRILNNNPILVFEDGKESRDFVYIDDVVNATVLALTRDEANGQIFGIGSGAPVSVLTAAETLRREYRANVPIEVTGQFRLGDIRHNYADSAKVRRLLGYQPSVDFESGIGRFVAWVRSQPLQADQYDRSVRELREKGLMRG
jgi:dTDP-L-rhamnose 4-epimerase